MTYEIIDNYLSKKDFEHIKNILFPQNLKSENNFTWNYQKGIVRNPDINPTGYEKYDWMYTRLLQSSDNELKFDKHYSIAKSILQKLNPKKILIVRCNLLVPTHYHVHHEFHVDRNSHHKVALYYVTTNNGFTILKNQSKINCIENRILLFDGNIDHCSVTSTDFPRCVFNINYQ